jgi:hypothetical protein
MGSELRDRLVLKERQALVFKVPKEPLVSACKGRKVLLAQRVLIPRLQVHRDFKEWPELLALVFREWPGRMDCRERLALREPILP